ncbi:MAG: energy-coupling factor ABC transporter permease [Burkholderiaceae bacterium]|nr:energy-coupling factor ABC transporter permease [Burkholderiaceae bacterium]
MHIEPGLVEPTKMAIGYVTAAGVLALTMHGILREVVGGNWLRLVAGTVVTLVATLLSFEVLPHPSVGVSEVHLIMGATLFLLFGATPAATGMAGGLLLQGLFFEPVDLAQYGMNVTTLLASLYTTAFVAKRLVSPQTTFADISSKQLVKLSMYFQGSVVVWVAFWVVLGQGATVSTIQSLASFGLAYTPVIAAEVLLSLTLLSLLRSVKGDGISRLLNPRLFGSAVA